MRRNISEGSSHRVKEDGSDASGNKRLLEELSVVYDALNSSVSGVIITNLDSRITYVNSAFLKTFEYSDKAQVLGKNGAALFAKGKAEESSGIQTFVDKTGGEVEEFIVQRSDGSIFPVEVSSSNVTDHRGNIVGRMASFVDITERRRTEQELRKVNEELKNFLSAVSHDLRQPILVVQGFADLLARKYDDKLDDKGREYLDHIKKSTARMASLASALMTLARIGHVVPIYKSIASAEIVQDAVVNLQQVMQSKGGEIVIGDDLPSIYCDAERIYQVFENLIANAIKFSCDNARPKVMVGYESDSDFHQFFVKDNGIGIDHKYHQKIFEMFSRLKEVNDEQGTGLGLAIVERIVNGHGGKVWVQSEKSKGATFFFSLPKRSSSS
jgi:PAS domain S-box-containing protein